MQIQPSASCAMRMLDMPLQKSALKNRGSLLMAVKKIPLLLFGPFDHLVTMEGLPDKGPIPDKNMHVLKEAGILVQEGKILAVKPYSALKQENAHKILFQRPMTALPSFIDAHTHICFAGSRLNDFQKIFSSSKQHS